MIFLIYRSLQVLFSPAILVYFLIRGLRNRRYSSTLPERFGVLPSSWKQTTPGCIWLHAVSVGEVLAAIPLLLEIRQQKPKVPIFVSTTTLAGRLTADSRLTGLTEGIFYMPFDIVWCLRRVFRLLKPSMVVVMETEIWPNLFREASRVGTGLAIANGRISDRARPRYRRFQRVFKQVLGLCDRILVQSEEMRARYVEAGAPPQNVVVSGNLKYDLLPPAIAPGHPVHDFLGRREGPVWIAASTSADERGEEETAVLAAQRQLAGWRLILAPRKPERFKAVARMLQDSGLRWARRSALHGPGDTAVDADILLLDSVGELGGVFEWCDAVFMGGTLVEKGGHNILEPAAFGKPVVAGPHMENFREIAAEFTERNAWIRIRTGDELAGAMLRAAHDTTIGERARAAAESKRGASAFTARALFEIYDSHFPTSRPQQPAFLLGLGMAWIWRVGSAIDRRRRASRARKLSVPVVSIGNITAGGTGKTPVTIELLDQLSAESIHVGLLLRGHRRAASNPVVVPDGRARLPLSQTGDEAQLYHRRFNIPIGIYADRFSVGKALIQQTGAEILLLDDGFQHLQLARDFDVVLIDALHPFGGGYLLPLGRLREPIEGLCRAHALVITRSDEVACTAAITKILRRYNSRAPIYLACTVARGWFSFKGAVSQEEVVGGGLKVAFCGLGNPHSFWRTLQQLGIATEEQLAFDDHHRYTPVELRRIARHAIDIGATILITTAKDAVNLFEECESLIAPLRLYWLDIGIEINDSGELFQSIAALARATGR